MQKKIVVAVDVTFEVEVEEAEIGKMYSLQELLLGGRVAMVSEPFISRPPEPENEEE